MNDNKKKNGLCFDDYKDAVSGGVLLCLSIAILVGANSIEGHALSNIVNAKFMPRIIGVAMALCSIVVMIQGIINALKVKKGDQPSAADAAEEQVPGVNKDELKPLAFTAALMLGYALLFRPLGFIVSSMLYVFLQIVCLTLPEKRTKKLYIVTAITAVVTSVGIYVMFRYGLDILLPVGILG